MIQLDGFKVYELRNTLGLSLRHIANMTGLSVQSLSKSEKTGHFAKYQSLVVSYVLDEYLRLNLGIDLKSAVAMSNEEFINRYIKKFKVKSKIEDLENQIKNLKTQLKELES